MAAADKAALSTSDFGLRDMCFTNPNNPKTGDGVQICSHEASRACPCSASCNSISRVPVHISAAPPLDQTRRSSRSSICSIVRPSRVPTPTLPAHSSWLYLRLVSHNSQFLKHTMATAESGEALARLRRELAASESPSWTALRDYLEQVMLFADRVPNRGLAASWTRSAAGCRAHLLSARCPVGAPAAAAGHGEGGAVWHTAAGQAQPQAGPGGA